MSRSYPPFGYRLLWKMLCTVLFTGGATLQAGAAEPVPEGYKMGDFRVVPSASLTQTWDDNIYGTPNNEKDDSISTLAAAVKANSEWARHRVNLDAGLSASHYADYDSEDVVDWGVGMDGRFDLSAKSHLLGGLRHDLSHEDRSSPDAAGGATEPTLLGTTRAHLGFAHRLVPFTIRLGGVFEKLNYDDVTSAAGMLDNDYRDRDQYSIGMRISLQTSAQQEIFFQAATDSRKYDDAASSGRDSDGYRLGLGMRFDHGTVFQAEGFLGYLTQDYDAVTYKDVNGLHFGGNLKWQPAQGRRLTAYVDRAVNETTLAGASSHLDTSIGGRIEHDLNERLTLNASVSFTNSEYQGHVLGYDQLDAGAGVRYYFDKRFFVSAGYRYVERDANQVAYDYSKNLIFITLGYAPRGR